MFLTVHAASGVVIGQATGNIWLALLAGFISHFILDSIPHGDQNLGSKGLNFLKKIGLVDTLTMLSLLNIIYFFGFADFSFPIMFGVIGTLLPDLLNAIAIFFQPKILSSYRKAHIKLHYMWNGLTVNFKQGLIIQAVFLVAFLAIIS